MRHTSCVSFLCSCQSLLLKFKQLNCPDLLVHLNSHQEIKRESSTNKKLKLDTFQKAGSFLSHFDTSIIEGYWFMPHSARVNFHFYNNGRFGFNDFNQQLNSYEYLQGTYRLSDSVLHVNYDDRPSQSFKFYKDFSDGDYDIIKRGY